MERQVDSAVSQPRTPPSSSTSPSKAVAKDLCPSPPLALPLLSASRDTHPPPVREPEGEDTCDQKPVTWQPSQKAFMIVTRQGAGIYFPPVRSPFHPLGPPGSAREPKRKSTVLAFSAASWFPSQEKHNSTHTQKKEQANFPSFCPFFAGQRCCLLHSAAWFLHPHTESFWWRMKSKCAPFQKTLFSQTHKAECIVSEQVFDQLPVASQYVGKICSGV